MRLWQRHCSLRRQRSLSPKALAQPASGAGADQHIAEREWHIGFSKRHREGKHTALM